MATTKRRIHGKGLFLQEEYVAAAAGIYPGMLVKMDSSGNVAVHADEGGRAELMLAIEDVLQGKTVSTVYTISTIVTCILPCKGGEVNALIEDGQNVAIGDHLISAGNGKFKVASDLESGETYDETLLVAVEACDLTGSATSDTLCACRVV